MEIIASRYNVHPKTNRCLLFLQFVTQNYTYSPGGNEWTDKAGRKVFTEVEMYRAFNDQNKRVTS